MSAYWSVDVDIKPDRASNCRKVNEHGVIPVAIMGSGDVDVRDIDPQSMSLQGLYLKPAGRHDDYPVSYGSLDGDGYEEMNTRFNVSDDWDKSESGMVVLSGRLANGTMVRGTDWIRGRDQWGPHRTRNGCDERKGKKAD